MIDICKQFPIKNHKISKENNSYQKQFDFSLPPEDRYFSEVMIQQKIGIWLVIMKPKILVKNQLKVIIVLVDISFG